MLRRNGFKLRAIVVEDDTKAGFIELLDMLDKPEPSVVVIPSLDHLVGNQLEQLCTHGDVWTLNPERRWIGLVPTAALP